MGGNTGLMNTQTTPRGPLLRRRPEILAGPLVILLFLAAILVSTAPAQTVLFGLGPDPYGEPEPGPAVFFCALAMVAAIVVAFTSASKVARMLSWPVMLAAWLAVLSFEFTVAFYGSELGWVEGTFEPVFWGAFATPPIVFLLACRLLPRPRLATYLGEPLMLLFVGYGLWATMEDFGSLDAEAGERQVTAILVFVGAAVYFGFAAWLVPSRRVFYGACAFAGVVIAVWGALGNTTATGYYEGFSIPVVSPWLIGTAVAIPVAGALIQAVLWFRARAARTVDSEVSTVPETSGE